MRYISTRGRAPSISFREAVLAGLAPDGGLYVPSSWPQFGAADDIAPTNEAFSAAAARILAKFAGDECSEDDLRAMAQEAYRPFDAPETAPLRELGDDNHLLELFHGPTLAFKDIAMRMLAQLYDWALAKDGRGKTIIGATSGDTGGAAINAFAGIDRAEVFMLHPAGRISEVQRRMMTTSAAANIVNIAVEGSFDDCQTIVKKLFADAALNKRLDLGGVNSINWVRLAVQTVYYATATKKLGKAASFVVPTGNFGDIFAGYATKRMGLEIRRLGVAVNENDIMRRAIRTGVYVPSKALPTSSPSMDIQVASNFERLLFEALDRNADALGALMDEFESDGRMTIPDEALSRIRADFCAEKATEAEVADKIRRTRDAFGVLVDPHTAVGLVALDKLRAEGEIKGPAIVLATAHPAKFPDAVEAACGERPTLPARFGDLMARGEQMVHAKADVAEIRALIEARSLFAN